MKNKPYKIDDSYNAYKWLIIVDNLSNVPSIDEAHEIQIQAGYHPAGYGFYGYNVKYVDTQRAEISWYCFKSCD